jgi:hypothetical protein
MEKKEYSITRQLELITEINSTQEDEKNAQLAKSFFEEFGTLQNNSNIIPFLQNLFLFDEAFFIKHGDDLADKVWELYDDKNFNLDIPEYKHFSSFFINLFFMNKNLVEQLLANKVFYIEGNRIKSADINAVREFNKELFPKLNQNELKSFLLDYLIMYIFSKAELRNFYTSLSSFLVGSKSNVMLLFKCLALFGLSLWQLEKRENFLDGLLYVIGGVLRDHARSYLKTKGILQENLSYHKCKDKVTYLLT